jgi:hypothetical protein
MYMYVSTGHVAHQDKPAAHWMTTRQLDGQQQVIVNGRSEDKLDSLYVPSNKETGVKHTKRRI